MLIVEVKIVLTTKGLQLKSGGLATCRNGLGHEAFIFRVWCLRSPGLDKSNSVLL